MSLLDQARGWFLAPPAPAAEAGWQAPPAAAAPDPSDRRAAGGEVVPATVITSAAVLGRPGEVEPVAAALALALRRESRARAAAVAVIGSAPNELGDGGNARPAVRRLAARLEAHGLEASVRGRLAWVRLDPGDPQLVPAARRVALVAAPAVLAVAAPRTAVMDEALAEQDLLIVVTARPDGPLARLAPAGLPGIPIVAVPPLTRGPVRSLARAGVRPARSIRALLSTTPERRT